MQQPITNVDGAVLVLGDDESGNQRMPYLAHHDRWWHIHMSGNTYPITDQVFDLLVYNGYIKSARNGVNYEPTRLCVIDAEALRAEELEKKSPAA